MKKSPTIWFLVMTVAGSLALTACGPEADTSPPKLEQAWREVAQHERASTNRPTTERDSAAGGAEVFIRHYFDDLTDRRHGQAWAQLSPRVQVDFGGYESWKDGYATTISSAPSEFSVTSESAGEVAVSFDLLSKDIDACGDQVAQVFSGNWTLRREAGRLTVADAEFEKVAGDDPVTDVSLCS